MQQNITKNTRNYKKTKEYTNTKQKPNIQK